MKKPENIPDDVWRAHQAWVNSKGTHAERLVYWDKFLEVRQRYFVQDGQWLPADQTDEIEHVPNQLSLF